MADIKMPTMSAAPREMRCHARIVACEAGRSIAIADIARDIANAPASFAIMNIIAKYDETTEERLSCARMLIKDEASDPDMVPPARDLLNVDLARAAVADAETIGVELRGCTRRIHIAEFAEGERVLCFVLETSAKKEIAADADVIARVLHLRDVSFDIVESVATGRKRR
jgi:hypothetical protein